MKDHRIYDLQQLIISRIEQQETRLLPGSLVVAGGAWVTVVVGASVMTVVEFFVVVGEVVIGGGVVVGIVVDGEAVTVSFVVEIVTMVVVVFAGIIVAVSLLLGESDDTLVTVARNTKDRKLNCNRGKTSKQLRNWF